jgi:hypothetical protein
VTGLAAALDPGGKLQAEAHNAEPGLSPEPEPAPAPAPIEAADVATAARSQRVTQLEAVSPPSSAPRPPGAALPDGDWTTASRGVSYHAIVIDVDTKDASLVRTPCPSPPQRRCSHKHPTPS